MVGLKYQGVSRTEHMVGKVSHIDYPVLFIRVSLKKKKKEAKREKKENTKL